MALTVAAAYRLSLVLPVVVPIRVPDHPLEVQTVKSLKYSGSGNQTLAVAARVSRFRFRDTARGRTTC